MQVSGGSVAQHRLRDQLRNCSTAGVRFPHFSPLRSDALDDLGAEWLAPRPSSDTVVKMGLAHTLLEAGKYARQSLDIHTVGFSELETYLLGHEDSVAKFAKWTSQISEISADEIQDLAEEMWSKQSRITIAASLQRVDYRGQPLWMKAALAAMLGQICLPGGGFGIAKGVDPSIGTMTRPMPWPSLPQGKNQVVDYIPVAIVTEMLK